MSFLSAPLEGKSNEELKKELLELARKEGFPYGVLVRKLKPVETGVRLIDSMVKMNMSGGGRNGKSLSEPIVMYRVYTDDGHEEMVRSARLDGASISTLRRIAGASGEQNVYNTIHGIGHTLDIYCPANTARSKSLRLK